MLPGLLLRNPLDFEFIVVELRLFYQYRAPVRGRFAPESLLDDQPLALQQLVLLLDARLEISDFGVEPADLPLQETDQLGRLVHSVREPSEYRQDGRRDEGYNPRFLHGAPIR